jgi:hypothetical protein
MVGVQGVKAIGAGQVEERWAQVLAACERVAARIEVVQAHDRVAVLACYGPSLQATWPKLAEAQAQGADVISVSGAHDFLLRVGVVPRYHVECDPRPHKALNIDQGRPDVTYLLASCVHSNVFDRLANTIPRGGDIRLWHVAEHETHGRLMQRGENPKHIISGGGSVGLRAIPLLYALGYRQFWIHGMDCSFADDGQTQWAGKHFGKRQDIETALCGDRQFYTSPVLMTYATGFFETTQQVKDCEFRLYGDGLLQAMAEAFNGRPETSNLSNESIPNDA